MQYKKYVVSIVAVILALAGISIASRYYPANTSRPAVDTASSTTINFGEGNSIMTSGGGTIELVSDTPAIKPPSLDVPVVIAASLPVDAQNILRANIETLTAQLKQDTTRTDLWLNLGVNRQIAGDYTGAAAAWTYVSRAAPPSMSYIAYGDLGDLYMNFIKDYPKSEINYKKAIEVNPSVIGYYRDLYTLYHYIYKVGTGADAAILEQGLKANPNNPDLLELQSQLKAGTN